MSVRVSLTGRVSIEARGVVIDEQRFPGRQGRLVPNDAKRTIGIHPAPGAPRRGEALQRVSQSAREIAIGGMAVGNERVEARF